MSDLIERIAKRVAAERGYLWDELPEIRDGIFNATPGRARFRHMAREHLDAVCAEAPTKAIKEWLTAGAACTGRTTGAS